MADQTVLCADRKLNSAGRGGVNEMWCGGRQDLQNTEKRVWSYGGRSIIEDSDSRYGDARDFVQRASVQYSSSDVPIRAATSTCGQRSARPAAMISIGAISLMVFMRVWLARFPNVMAISMRTAVVIQLMKTSKSWGLDHRSLWKVHGQLLAVPRYAAKYDVSIRHGGSAQEPLGIVVLTCP